MKKQTKSKLILCILIATVLLGISFNKFIGKYVKSNNNSNNDILSELGNAGDWGPEITRAIGVEPYGVFIGDANNDGYNDIVTANLGSDTVSIFLWNSILNFWDSQITRAVGDAPYGLHIGDVNNDGDNDIVTSNLSPNTVSILLWNSSSGDWDPQITKNVGNSPYGLFIGDANNDGENDIVTANYGSDDLSILLWNSTSGDWDPMITRTAGTDSSRVFIGDANNDGDNDIVCSNAQSDTVSIFLWNSTSGDWDSQITRASGDRPMSVFIGDANNDGDNDIVTSSNMSPGMVSIILWNSSSGDWDPEITRSMGQFPYDVFIGDANNDGYNDIAVANPNISGTISLLLWNSTSGDWDPQIVKNVGNRAVSIFIGDANNDGYNDIANVNRDSYTLSLFLWKPSELLKIEITNMFFALSEFKIEFYVYNRSGMGIDFASIQMWWNGTNVSSDIQNLGNGSYFISLEPITVISSEDSILLNMTLSAPNYEDIYFETFIGVQPFEIENNLNLEVNELNFSLEHFNFTFSIFDDFNQFINFAGIIMWWNGDDVSLDIQNIGNGFYFISLEPITVAPGEDPILLNMTVSATGYADQYFEMNFAVDPDSISKGDGESPEGFPLALIIIISVVGAGIFSGIIGIYWSRRRKK